MKNRGSALDVIVPCLFVIVMIFGWIFWCFQADASTSKAYAIDGYVIVIGETKAGTLLYNYVWKADRIAYIDRESDGIDIGIKGQTADSNIYNMSAERFAAVWDAAKTQLGPAEEVPTKEATCKWCGRETKRAICENCGKSATQPAK